MEIFCRGVVEINTWGCHVVVAVMKCSPTGAHFTHVFSITIHVPLKFGFVFMLFLVKSPLQRFVNDTIMLYQSIWKNQYQEWCMSLISCICTVCLIWCMSCIFCFKIVGLNSLWNNLVFFCFFTKICPWHTNKLIKQAPLWYIPCPCFQEIFKPNLIFRVPHQLQVSGSFAEKIQSNLYKMEMNSRLSQGHLSDSKPELSRLDPHEIDLSDGATDCCKLGDNWL